MKSLDLDGFAATRYEEKDGTQIVSVTGELDLSSAPRLREVIWRAGNSPLKKSHKFGWSLE